MTEGHNHIRLLTINGDILSFQCQHSSQSSTDSHRGSEITFRKISFKRDINNFSTQNDSVSPLYSNNSTEVDIVHCTSTLDVQKRLTVPCILLKLCKKTGSGFKYMLYSLNSSTRAELHVEFKLAYEMRDNISILQGPTVVWSHEDTVFYTSVQAGGVREVPIQLSVSFIGELPLHKRKLIVLGAQKLSNEDLRDQSGVTRRNKSLVCFIEDGNSFDGTCILPDAYSSVVQCIIVVSAEEVKGALKSTVVAVTNRKQLVCFENGVPRDVCQLPFEEPQSIQMVHTGSSGSLFAISFSYGNVCTVWKDTFQVAACWSGVSSLLVDDFVGCGTDQMLLVFEDPGAPGDSLRKFIITDLCGTTYSCGQESSGALNTPDTAQGNYLLTVQALESRLQGGLTLLQDLQRDIEVKDRVLQQSVHALTDLVSGREHVMPSAEQEDLVSMWDDDDEKVEEALGERMQIVSEEAPLQVESVWQRVFEDCLVFGVLLTTGSDIPVENVSASILTEGGGDPVPAAIHTRSRVFRVPTPQLPSHPEPAAKRNRQDGASGGSSLASVQRLALTAVTDLTPLLTSATVKCPVMLHYTPNETSSASACAPGPLVSQCGQVSLNMQDLAQGKFHPHLLKNCKLATDESREDLFSLLAVLDSWFFLVASPDHTLCDVPEWLQDTMQCQRVEISPQYLLANPAGPSAVMLFHWQQKTLFQGELAVHCSGQCHLLQFLDSLCRFLPASYHIQPLGKGGSENSPQDLALSLEREVLALKEGVCSLLHGDEEGREGRSSARGALDPTASTPTAALQRRRDEWESDRERSKRRLSPLVEMDRYRELTQSLFQVQLEGDVTALLETQAGSVPL